MAKTPDIKEIQAEIKETAGKVWLAGLGALASARDEGSEVFKTLVKKGEEYESRGRDAIHEVKGEVEEVVDKAKDQANSAADKVEDRLDAVVSGALKRFGVPSREEIGILTKRVEELTSLVEQLKPVAKKPAAARKPAAKKPAAKTTAKTTATKAATTKAAATKAATPKAATKPAAKSSTTN